MKFFNPPFTKESIDKQFKELSKILHPDKGGDKNSFQELTREKDLALKLAEYFKTKRSPGRIKMMKRKKPTPVIIKHTNYTITPENTEKAIKLLIEFKKLFK